VVEKLLASSQGQATPGAERAVGTAVDAAVQGAAAGDPRLRRALAFLEAGNAREAEPLFRAVADEKAARISQDKKDAAAAYRNLGAIAALGDPKKALDAYEKALEFDPDDVDSLFRAGEIQIERGDLDTAQMRLDRVLSLATVDQPFYQYWARLGLGDIRKQRGNLATALASYRDGLAIADRQTKSDPGNAGWQRELSVSYERIGDVQVEQGDLAGALQSYRDSLAIRERLAKTDPGNTGWQRDLSMALDKVGDVNFPQGDLAGALKFYRDSLAIKERLAKSDPGNAGSQLDLSFSYEKVGDVQVEQGDLAGALKSYRDSLAIRESLAKSDPGNAGWQHDLSSSYGRLASLFKKTNENAKALDALQQGRAIMVRLTGLSPDNAVWKRELAGLDREIADLTR
jgi:tetratricopeptide (TPR) repeat protein